jgi:hypothetical protein
VCGRQVQDVNRIGRLHELRSGQVRDRYRTNLRVILHGMYRELQLACGELVCDELHLCGSSDIQCHGDSAEYTSVGRGQHVDGDSDFQL